MKRMLCFISDMILPNFIPLNEVATKPDVLHTIFTPSEKRMPEFEGWQSKRRDEFSKNPPFDVRMILFGKPLFEFIKAEYLAQKDSTGEDLLIEIHAKWLMTTREDLRGQTPREMLLEKCDFIESDLDSRSRQWSFTGIQPPALPEHSKAYHFAGFGRHEIIVYYDLFRYLLGECFENEVEDAEVLEQLASNWLNNPQADLSDRIPADIIKAERKRINLTVSAHECVIDEDCEMCEMMAVDFIDTPMFWGLDGSNMEYDRFEFSFFKSRADWEAEQRQMEEFDRKFDEKYRTNSADDFPNDETLF